MSTQRDIGVYVSKAAFMAEDLCSALDRLGYGYERLEPEKLGEVELKAYKLVIMPGGDTPNMLKEMGRQSLEAFRDAVAQGTNYVGICAGAYLAAAQVNVPGEPEGLNIIRARMRRLQGRGIFPIEICNTHPVTDGYEGQVDVYRQNGPLIECYADAPITVIARYVGDYDMAAIVSASYQAGKVLLMSVHPEGSLHYGYKPEELGTLRLVKNAVDFCL